MDLSNVTVIIPAHNRPGRLQRLLDYYEGTGVRIIVPDSSDKPFTGHYNESSTTYIHRPRLHFLHKVHEIIPLISTPYVLYCADDDFAVPEGIKDVIDFLDRYPDYVVAQGYYVTFKPMGDGLVNFSPRYIRHFNSRVTGETPLERLMDTTPQYASLLYGVVRAEVFKKMYEYCFDEYGELRFNNLFLAEEFFCHATRLYGKYATVPTFFSARETIPGSATSTTVPQSVVKNAAEYHDEYMGFIESLAMMLHNLQPEVSLENARRRVFEANHAPLDSQSVQFKRRVLAFCDRHAMLHPIVTIMNHRYEAKGRKATTGLPGYPTTDNPALLKIKQAILTSSFHS